MKDFITKRKRMGEIATVALTEECNQLIQGKLPLKLKDPRRLLYPATLEIPLVEGNYIIFEQVLTSCLYLSSGS